MLLTSQVSVAKNHILRRVTSQKICLNYDQLKPLACADSETIKVVKSVISLAVTTASTEPLFSVLSLVRTHLRTSMTNDHLSALLLMASEKAVVRDLHREALVDHFAKQKSHSSASTAAVNCQYIQCSKHFIYF